MTLGNAAAARVRLIVWCKACGRRVEPDAAEMAERYGADSAVPEWRERLVCSRCGSRNVEHRGDRDRAAVALTGPRSISQRTALDPACVKTRTAGLRFTKFSRFSAVFDRCRLSGAQKFVSDTPLSDNFRVFTQSGP